MSKHALRTLVAQWRQAAEPLTFAGEEYDSAEEEANDALASCLRECADDVERVLSQDSGIGLILSALASDQSNFGEQLGNVTITLATGEQVTGIIESTEGDVVSIRRDLTRGGGESYADIPRHYAISAVVGAFISEGS